MWQINLRFKCWYCKCTCFSKTTEVSTAVWYHSHSHILFETHEYIFFCIMTFWSFYFHLLPWQSFLLSLYMHVYTENLGMIFFSSQWVNGKGSCMLFFCCLFICFCFCFCFLFLNVGKQIMTNFGNEDKSSLRNIFLDFPMTIILSKLLDKKGFLCLVIAT